MPNGFNLVAIYTANVVAVTLLLLLLSGNYWKVNWHREEALYLKALFIAIIVAAITDCIAFTVDGRPGKLMGTINYFCSLIPFLMDIVAGYSWVIFLIKHLNGEIRRWHVFLLKMMCLCATVVFLSNFFYPTIFYIDARNAYVRGPLFLLSIAINSFFFIDSIIIYFVIRRRSGELAFFPIWKFIIPILIAVMIQTLVYGVSLFWVGAAIAMVGVVTSLQSELIYYDKLTGLYNRFYLDGVRDKMTTGQDSEYTVMMLDLNGFKSINDQFGHSVGDEALIHCGQILKRAVGSRGNVIRYAGDEFVVVLNTKNTVEAGEYVSKIYEEFDHFNDTSMKPYKLYASVGYCVFDLKNSTVEAMMNMVDKLMYEDKSRFYAEHPEFERRK